ncbi:hypothetical protein B9Q02_03665 [Candidatus Marsarchaeota G1 archaeon BE_D]|jgi:Amino acid transporters|uniref:Amino acid permease/ SLC12A domain-containing protein n=1 Tax=Candidatus Marsarchaeota G1 archaeon BE_D TaxID=1978156 RepID=A0A2R6AI82_9ARCH|nr:MAG: hypothetical protein B9Q02_03665 [Candidatus Marsarchaeota G1 archaeon BE_D]
MTEKTLEELKRALGLKETFFISLGGQSPLLSLLTYGAAVLSISGFFSPIAVLLGTLLVLLNGSVVSRLSLRFQDSGGYYTYASRALSKALGFQTGWLYAFYSILYGCAYIFGASYLLNLVFGLPVYLSISVLLIPSVTLLILGVKPSSKYAVVVGALELGVIVFLSIFFLSRTHFEFYTLKAPNLSVGKLALAILLASSIPTGYGTVAPMSGEVINASKNVGRAILLVILVGGALASFYMYSLSDLLQTFGGASLVSFHTIFKGTALPVVLLACLSDGVLAALAFMLASSRTLFKMGRDLALPRFFAKVRNSNPLMSSLIVSLAYISICYSLSWISDPFHIFVVLGILSSLASLATHIAANFSLLRLSLNDAHFYEFALSLGAIAVSALDLFYSLTSVALFYLLILIAWTLIGQLYSRLRRLSHDNLSVS